MASRTYVPTLRFVTNELKKYVNRNQIKLQQNLSAPTYQLLLDLLTIADALLVALGAPDINP